MKWFNRRCSMLFGMRHWGPDNVRTRTWQSRGIFLPFPVSTVFTHCLSNSNMNNGKETLESLYGLVARHKEVCLEHFASLWSNLP